MAPGPSEGGSRSLSDDRAVSATVGMVLLLGLTILGAGVVVTLGAQAIDQTQQSAHISRAEQSMTLLDARVAQVALGETPSKRVQFADTGEGQITVHEGAGWVRITHVNYTASSPPKNETIYNASFGTVTYTNRNTVIAYQGGGVWRGKTDSNGSVMVSPPEFYYQGATLTFPIIQVSGDDSGAGRVTSVIDSPSETRPIYPNVTGVPNDDSDEIGAPYNDTERAYRNPVRNGTVQVTVKSEYYQGWAEYFRTRSNADVQVDHARSRVIVTLQTQDLTGLFNLDDEQVDIKAMKSGHSVDQFSVTLQMRNNFNNAYFSFWTKSDGIEYELMVYIKEGSGNDYCDDGVLTDGEVPDLTAEVYYNNTTATTGYHTWSNSSVDPNDGDIQLQCTDSGGVELVADFTGDTKLNYTQATIEEKRWHFDREDPRESSAYFDHDGVAGEPATFDSTDDQATINLLTNHYFAHLAPDATLRVHQEPGNSDRVDTALSFGELEYEQNPSGRFITYLQITENGIEVRLE